MFNINEVSGFEFVCILLTVAELDDPVSSSSNKSSDTVEELEDVFDVFVEELLVEELYVRIEKLYAECNNSDNKKIRNELFFCIDLLYMHFRERSKSSEYNTEDYYKKTISELNGPTAKNVSVQTDCGLASSGLPKIFAGIGFPI